MTEPVKYGDYCPRCMHKHCVCTPMIVTPSEHNPLRTEPTFDEVVDICNKAVEEFKQDDEQVKQMPAAIEELKRFSEEVSAIKETAKSKELKDHALKFAEYIRLERYEMGISDWFKWELDDDQHQRMINKTSEELYEQFLKEQP